VQSEPGIRSSPGELDLLDPVTGTFSPRNSGVQIRLIFEEVEMSPGTLACIVDLAQRLTIGARKPCPSLEVDEDVQLLLDLVQLHFAHEPWAFSPNVAWKSCLSSTERVTLSQKKSLYPLEVKENLHSLESKNVEPGAKSVKKL
jgi:hypothetical protein